MKKFGRKSVKVFRSEPTGELARYFKEKREAWEEAKRKQFERLGIEEE